MDVVKWRKCFFFIWTWVVLAEIRNGYLPDRGHSLLFEPICLVPTRTKKPL